MRTLRYLCLQWFTDSLILYYECILFPELV